MEKSKIGEFISDLILPAGLIFLAYEFLKGQGLIGKQAEKISTAVSSECPRGQRYSRGLFGSCDANYESPWYTNQTECICMSTILQPEKSVLPSPKASNVWNPFQGIVDILTPSNPTPTIGFGTGEGFGGGGAGARGGGSDFGLPTPSAPSIPTSSEYTPNPNPFGPGGGFGSSPATNVPPTLEVGGGIGGGGGGARESIVPAPIISQTPEFQPGGGFGGGGGGAR